MEIIYCKNLFVLALILVTNLLSGCSTKINEILLQDFRIEESIGYYDKNCDWEVDEEYRRIINMSDANYSLVDVDFDGFYDARIVYGFGRKDKINIEVAKDVFIQKQEKCESLPKS